MAEEVQRLGSNIRAVMRGAYDALAEEGTLLQKDGIVTLAGNI